MAKKKKRQLQPHEKGFAKAVLWAVVLAVVITVLSWPREITCGQAHITIREQDTYRSGRHSVNLRIISTEGRKYDIVRSNCEVSFWTLKELLVPGTEVDVEYYYDTLNAQRNPGFSCSVTKLTLDGQLLVQGKVVKNTDSLVLLWVCPAIVLLGFLRWASGEHLLSKWKKKREKERKKRKRHEQSP